MHLYYIPIVLMAYHYRKKGIFLSALLGLLYVSMVIYFLWPDIEEVLLAFERVVIFIFTASVIAWLSDKLERSRIFFKTLSEISPAGIIRTDAEGICSYVNKRFTGITGIPKEQALGEGVCGLIYTEDKEKFSSDWSACTQNGTRMNHEYRFMKPDGTTAWVLFQAGPEKNVKGNITGYIATITDLTRIKTAEMFQRTQFAFEHSPDDIYFTNRKGEVVYANISAKESFGIKTENNTDGKTVFSINPDIDPERWEEIWKIIVKDDFFKFESLHRFEDGSLHPVEISQYHFTYNGEEYSCSIARDITDRKKIETALKESEEKYRILAEASLDPIFIIDLEDTVLYANKRAAELLNSTPEKIIGRSRKDLFKTDVAESQINSLRMVAETGEPLLIETKTRYNENYFWQDHSLIPLKDETGKVYAILGLSHDITDRKNAEEALKESEEKYRTLVELAGEGIWTVDSAGITTFVNPGMAKALGYTVEEMVGSSFFNFMDEEGLEKAKLLFKNNRKGEIKKYDFEFVRSDGRKIYTIITTSPLIDSKGKFTGVLALINDITERHLAEKSLEEVNKKLNLMSNITRHDILNQITAAAGYLELMELDKVIPPGTTADKYLEKVSGIIETIKQQIQFTAYYKNLGEQRPDWFNIGRIVTETYMNNGFDNIELKNNLKNVEVLADPLFEKVIYTLFDNASVHGEKISQITFNAEETKNGLLITCEDDGIGIPDDAKEKIFRREYYKNSGLGLFLSKGILAMTGLKIRETGQSGEGARFEISVPEGKYRFTNGN